LGEHPVFSDFNVFNPASGKSYKVAIRSKEPGLNFCSCPDFKINLLGTCKHIENLLHKINANKKHKRLLELGNKQYYSSISLKYGTERNVYLRIGENNNTEIKKLAKEYFDSKNFLKTESFDKFESFFEQVIKLDPDFRSYQDAVDYIIDIRRRNQRINHLEFKYENINSEYFDTLINTKLYNYQKEGILFAAKAGRCLIADDMGLGKTIQAIATSELLANEFSIDKVLIICPTSLKYQWKTEIEKFTKRSVMVIEGAINKRIEQYLSDEFYKIASYNSVRYDLNHIFNFAPDVIILDEAQRIKNWKTKTAQSVKQLSSEFAIVLTGTPLENRLEELHSIIEFVDRYKLGALFRFLNKHEIHDDSGKIIGYKGLNNISKTLNSILIRRKKNEVLKQLPERIDKNYFVPATPQQMEIHNNYYEMVCKLVNKWRKFKFLSEPDRKRLLLGLSCMRMVSDSTYILDQKTRHDTKIDELMILLKDIFENKSEKVVVFSQWERMTRIVSKELEKLNVKYEYLHGGVPSAKRKDLLTNFHNKPESKVFLSTDAGGIGLNLQCANVVINLDIPWNPAVLEQRIARVHRLGQGKHVRVINFVTSGSIEERILDLLNFKQSVFEGVFDKGEDSVFMSEDKFKKIMDVVGNITEPPIEMQEFEIDKSTESEIYGITEIQDKVQKPVFSDVAKEAEQPELFEAKETETKTETQNIQDLFVTGIEFLNKLSNTFSDKQSTKSLVAALVNRDEKTGKMSINIPISDESIIEKAVNVLDSFLQLLKNK
jgi:SNF2 family DNA or RNA helicase